MFAVAIVVIGGAGYFVGRTAALFFAGRLNKASRIKDLVGKVILALMLIFIGTVVLNMLAWLVLDFGLVNSLAQAEAIDFSLVAGTVAGFLHGRHLRKKSGDDRDNGQMLTH